MGLVFRSHLQRGQCSGLRPSGMWRITCWCLLMGVSRELIGPIFKGQAAQKEFLFDSAGPAVQELSRSNRRLEQLSYDRNVTALYYPTNKKNSTVQDLCLVRLHPTLWAILQSSHSNCKIYMTWEREDSSKWILDNPSVWIHLTTEAETDTSWSFCLTVITLKLIRTHQNYSTCVTC